jgi:hypothetical protein
MYLRISLRCKGLSFSAFSSLFYFHPCVILSPEQIQNKEMNIREGSFNPILRRFPQAEP